MIMSQRVQSGLAVDFARLFGVVTTDTDNRMCQQLAAVTVTASTGVTRIGILVNTIQTRNEE